MRKFIALLAGALAALAVPAAAQVGSVPQVGVTSGYQPKVTYSAAFVGLVPAASATDVICLAGSATKTVKLLSIRLGGSAGTAVAVPVTLVRRVSVNTGGTAASTTANPANTIAKRDTGNATATAVPISYTANPTIVDTSPTYLDSFEVYFGVTTASIASTTATYNIVDSLAQPPTLTGAAAQLCLNFNAVSISSGLANGSITWTEE
jgi:hypothetical protein